MTQTAGGEARWRRIAGLLLMAVAMPAFTWLSERADWQPWAEALRSGQLLRRGALFVAAGNVFALGLLVLFSGSTDAPVLRGSRARRSLLIRMAGANLLIILIGLVLLEEQGVFGGIGETAAIMLIAVALGLLGRTGVLLVRRGWKYHAQPAHTVLEQDTRPPVVYIRSFADDDAILLGSRLQRLFLSIFTYMAAVSPEQELARILRRVGPVVAIGRPGEPLPELGAARLYASDDQWRDVMRDLMRRARLVVVRAGATPNLQWEIDEAIRLLPLRRLVMVSFAGGKAGKSFEEGIARRFGGAPRPQPIPAGPVRRSIERLLGMGRLNSGCVVWFDEDSRPCAVPIRFAIGWTGFFSAWTRPHHDPLNAAFRLVFARLDLPWIGRRTRTIAALLALFGGVFGAHWFYIGDRRRALWHLAFFWTMVPFFLGLKDAIRFAVIDDREFERRFTGTLA